MYLVVSLCLWFSIILIVLLESLLMFPLLSSALEVIPACIILHLKHSTFSVLELVLKVYLSKLHKF
eukprot:SAG11_NODE_1559_length_4675_cov_4.453493_3_plen_66_part_00